MSHKELRRVLSKLGVASRKESEKIIRDGRISVNGKVVRSPIQPVNLTDNILLDNREIKEKKVEIYALNKPKGYVTTMSKEQNNRTVSDLMPDHQYLFPVGRLDKDSKGLILFTNDNDFANYIQSNDTNVEKTYKVQVKGEFNENHANQILQKLVIDNVQYSVKNLEVLKINQNYSWIKIVLCEGKNREIRKILKHFGYKVLTLNRIQIGKLKLEYLNLESGKYTLVSKRDIV